MKLEMRALKNIAAAAMTLAVVFGAASLKPVTANAAEASVSASIEEENSYISFQDEAYQNEFLRRVNNERAKAGLKPVQLYTHSKDTKSLKGANRHANANASQIVEPMIKIAAGKTFAPNYEEKHVADAKYGWYRYDTRFAIPVYNDEGNLCRYNIFGARILIRHDEDGKMYLYDILRIKKETSEPLEQ